jgi:DNA-binding transcriptional regulator YdaS (Cro superfamily)
MSSLATLLKNRGQTLSDLARELKVNKATVSRWNKKKIPTDRISAIEKATGIAMCDLRPDLATMFSAKQKAVAQ